MTSPRARHLSREPELTQSSSRPPGPPQGRGGATSWNAAEQRWPRRLPLPPDAPFPRPRQGTPRPCFLGAARGRWLPLGGPLTGAVLPLAQSLPGGLSRPPTPASTSPVTPAPSSLGPCTLLTPSEPPPAECRGRARGHSGSGCERDTPGKPAPSQTAASPMALRVLAEAMAGAGLPASVCGAQRVPCPTPSWRCPGACWLPRGLSLLSRVAPAVLAQALGQESRTGRPLPRLLPVGDSHRCWGTGRPVNGRERAAGV